MSVAGSPLHVLSHLQGRPARLCLGPPGVASRTCGRRTQADGASARWPGATLRQIAGSEGRSGRTTMETYSPDRPIRAELDPEDKSGVATLVSRRPVIGARMEQIVAKGRLETSPTEPETHHGYALVDETT